MSPVLVSVNGKMKGSTEDVNEKTQRTNLWKVKTTPVEGIGRDSSGGSEKMKGVTYLNPITRNPPPMSESPEIVRSRQLTHLVKEIKQGNNKASTSKTTKKPEAAPKDKELPSSWFTPGEEMFIHEAVILVEIGMPSLRCSMIDKNKNDEGLLLNLDLLEEKRELASISQEKHKRKMERYYNLKVFSTVQKPDDLVYRSNEARKKEDTGKLCPKWEGPYEIIEALGDGPYKLQD
ncbi:hypothetical protein Tco_0393050 [Tanacetum coccineum]